MATAVEIDPRWEFDAPKYCDLLEAAAEADGDPEAIARAQLADRWFDRAAQGKRSLRSPAKGSPPLTREQVEPKTNGWVLVSTPVNDENVPNTNQPAGSRTSPAWCNADVDAMDVDSPAPITAPKAAPAPDSAHRPLTRSQVKQNPTFSRLLLHLEGNTVSAQKAKAHGGSQEPRAHSSMKRRHQAPLQPRSSRPLTDPMDIDLMTSKRQRMHPMETRTATPAKQEFVPLVERARLFHEGPNERWARASGPPQLDTRPPPPLTNPKTPTLRSKSRAASRSATQPPPPAGPSRLAGDALRAKGRATAAPPSAAARHAPRTTHLQPFHFATDQRICAHHMAAGKENAAQAAAGKAALKPAARAAPKTPNFRTKERAAQRGAGAFVFSAEGNSGGGSGVPSARKQRVERRERAPGVTKPKPFNLQTEKRSAASSSHHAPRQAAPAYHFRARPVPITTEVHQPPRFQPRGLTIPESPALRSKVLHQKYQEQRRKQMEEEVRGQQEAARFKARGMLVAQPFLPQPSEQPLTIPHQPRFVTDQRAVERSEFDRTYAEKERQAQIEREAALAAQRRMEEVEVRRMRRSMVPKARPMPDFSQPFCPSRGEASLTEAHTPRLQTRSRATRHMR